MVYPYISHIQKTYIASGDEYLYDERVETRNILHVTHIAAYHDTPTDADNIEIGITDGTFRYKLDYVQLTEDLGMLGRKVDIHVPENRGIYAYFSTAASGDINELLVCGVLYLVDEWKREHGAKP